MQNIVVKMKDGRDFESTLYLWKPKDGYFSLHSDGSLPPRIFFRDCEKAVAKQVLIRKGVFQDLDLLAKAKVEGWTNADLGGVDNGDKTVTYEAVCTKESPKAIFVEIAGGIERWIPKSAIDPKKSEVLKPDDMGELVIFSWWAEKALG